MSSFLLAFLALFFCSIQAAEIHALSSGRTENEFWVSLDAVLDASPEQVWQVLIDHNRLPETTASLLQNEVVETASPWRQKVASKTRLCALIFCKTLKHTQWMEQVQWGELVATIVGEESDFSRGSGLWRVSDQAGKARLQVDIKLTVKFWVPPLIGTWAIKRAMRREFRQMSANIERVAQKRLLDPA